MNVAVVTVGLSMTNNMTIPVFKPNLRTQEILDALKPVLNSGWIGLGPKVKQFEDEFAALHRMPHAVALNSCTDALHLSLRVLGIGHGDEVLVPALTFGSTALAAMYVGATPVFVDSCEDTLCLDPLDIERKITPRTRAIMVVHYGGHPANMLAILEIAKRHNLRVIEDCAHAIGATLNDELVGTFGDIAAFSFHAVKGVPIGDGGMILLRDAMQATELRKLRWLGIDKDTWARQSGEYAWRYSIDDLGYKMHMSDIPATIGLVQLKYMRADIRTRAALALRYSTAFAHLTKWLRTPIELSGVKSAWHNYVIRLDPSIDREGFMLYLADKGISTSVHYEPLTHHGVFQKSVGVVPVVERIWTTLVTLPLFAGMMLEEHDYVVASVNDFFSEKV